MPAIESFTTQNFKGENAVLSCASMYHSWTTVALKLPYVRG